MGVIEEACEKVALAQALDLHPEALVMSRDNLDSLRRETDALRYFTVQTDERAATFMALPVELTDVPNYLAVRCKRVT